MNALGQVVIQLGITAQALPSPVNVSGQAAVKIGITAQAVGLRNLFGGIQAKITNLNPKSKVVQLSPISKISTL